MIEFHTGMFQTDTVSAGTSPDRNQHAIVQFGAKFVGSFERNFHLVPFETE